MATNMQNSNCDDIFHDIIMTEERSQNEGFNEGRAKGEVLGLLEGCRLGFDKGLALGSEIGFYKGFVLMRQDLMTDDTINPRVEKSLKSLEKMLSIFPVLGVLNDSLFDDLEKIRSKFKQVTSLLKISISYGGQTAELKGASF